MICKILNTGTLTGKAFWQRKIYNRDVTAIVADSEQLAKEGRIEEAIEGFKTAQKWNPSLYPAGFDPVIRAKQLAEAAKPKS